MLSGVYRRLLACFGFQGWWPLLSHQGSNPTKTGFSKGYHPGDYSFPRNRSQRFEICAGAILAQNTGWPNAEKALNNLHEKGMLSPEKIISFPAGKISGCIRPAGYYNHKARKLREFSKFFVSLGKRKPSRDDLLKIWGIGPETADSILLYAYNEPVFVIDAYTRRIMERAGFGKMDYDELQKLFHDNLKKDHAIYNEFHALLVELAKRHCKAVPKCEGCPLFERCRKEID